MSEVAKKLNSELNCQKKVEFREKVLEVQKGLLGLIENGDVKDAMPDCELKHYFTPKNEKFGCYTYARELTIPKGMVVIGKIHRHAVINILTQGKILVVTEDGKKVIEAPQTFVSEPGVKRAVYALERTTWINIHTVSHGDESMLDEIEAEVIAPDYAELGLVSTLKALEGEI